MDFEPMTLGSPVNSPTHVSPVLHQVSHGSSQFLPGYLMGDVNALTTPTSRNKSFNMKSQYNSPMGGMSSKSPPQLHKGVMQGSKQATFLSPPLCSKEKVGTPPVHTLLDDINQSDVGYLQGLTDLPMRHTMMQHEASLNISYASPLRHSAHKSKTPPSPGQSDPFYTQGELITPNTQLDDTWVTVFGYPPSAASFIIQRFSQYGNIISHHTASNGGNWMHIHYETSLQARKASSKNGKVFPGNLMIGVVPCIDVSLMSEQSILRNENTSIYQSPAHHNMSRTATPLRSQKLPTLRPLTAAYNAAASDHTVTSNVSTPQKTNGLMTKALDYLFG